MQTELVERTNHEVVTFAFEQTLAGVGMHLPTRMSVVPVAPGKLALISPIPIDDALAKAIEALGQVEWLIAPNLLHHLYLRAAVTRYPRARVLAPPGLAKKEPALRIDATLEQELPPALARALQVVRIEGAPSVDEFVFFHRDSRTLVVTELVFNIVRPRGFVAHIVLFLVGCHGKLAQSRAWRMFVKNRAAARESVRRVMALPIRRLVVAHGDIVETDAAARLAHALRWLA